MHNRKATGLVLALCVIIAAMLATVPASASPADHLRGAAGKIDITPSSSVYLAGYAADRKSTGVHDPIWARCIVLDDGRTRIALVSCDVIGLPRYRVSEIRALVRSVPSSHVYISATHTHSGPDTMGQWGPAITASGVDRGWMQATVKAVAQLIDNTAARTEPAAVKFASSTDVPRVSKNIREPSIIDRELSVMQLMPRNGRPAIATLVNYACHPEILNTHQITADFPGWIYRTVEGAGGGTCLYLNGAQGGMVTADYDEATAPKFENWGAAESIGTQLGQRAMELIRNAAPVDEPSIEAQQRVFSVPLENDKFKALVSLHVFPGNLLKNGEIETEVNRIVIGPAEFITFPGEVLPNIGLALKKQMRGKYKFQLGLTSDELGYILTAEDYTRRLFSYETSQSVGRRIGPEMITNLKKMMDTTVR